MDFFSFSLLLNFVHFDISETEIIFVSITVHKNRLKCSALTPITMAKLLKEESAPKISKESPDLY